MNYRPEDILGNQKITDGKRRVAPLHTRADSDPEYYQFDTPNRLPVGDGTWAIAKGKVPLKYLLRDLKEGNPDIFRMFFPRIFNHADHFGDWKWAYYCAASHCQLALVDPEYTRAYEAERNALSHAMLWQTSGLNSFFVAPDLFRAASQTEPPAEMDFSELKMPHEALCFILPKGAMQFRGENVDFLGFARIKKGQYIIGETLNRNGVRIDGIKVDLPEDKFIMTTAVHGVAVHFGVGFYEHGLKTILREGSKAMLHDALMDGITDAKKRELTDDTHFVQQALYICLNLILAMEVRPALVERGRKLTMSKRDRLTEVWSPNVVGSKYRIVYSKGGAEKGTHSSPRAHWRRGHFRRQGFGKRIAVHCLCGCRHDTHPEHGMCMTPDCPCFKYREVGGGFHEYKTVWIEPVYVGLQTTA